ncbi:Mediator of RNA polymerase II transcription subunit 6 [Frankliniella fusca]|uniref:Mediator of RNA polymerase II transcription subunit 6 n=1 Tax=Frankliniella fusca TaxID=407009 RepID=A0AAE1LP87_9NEOP|nr:Mediator of RNA polymerase II transcription subunit 6 [Frankliniella fusca]
MMPGRLQGVPENPLTLSWHDSAWIPMLNPTNVMDYFSEKSNPFYDRTCNNEVVRMQRLGMDQLNSMTGLEYILLHVQEPILYVIRKQHRHSPSQATPIADYYIIAGIIYQAPDLNSVLNSRLLSTVHHLQSAFDEASSFSRYHPSKGYSWDFKDRKSREREKQAALSKKDTVKEQAGSQFQRHRVHMLLAELSRKFPEPALQPRAVTASADGVESKPEIKTEIKPEVKTEPGAQPRMKPPPEKKPRLN